MNPDPRLLDVLDRAVAETGVEHYRHLCLSHPDPAVRERWSAWIMAGRPSVAPPPRLMTAAEVDDSLRRARADLAGSKGNPCGKCPGSG